MEKKYISENRYKKVARSDRKKRTVARKKKSKSITKVPIANNRMPNTTSTHKTKKVIKKKKSRKIKRIFFCFLSIVIIAIISRLIFKEESEPFLPDIFEEKIINTEEIVIGVVEEDISSKYINNVIIQELDRYVYPTLLNITSSYELKYCLVDSIEKISNEEYILYVNKNYGVSSSKINGQLEEYLNKDNMYYANVKNIDKIEIIDNSTLKIYLKSEDEYFAYSLNLPIYTLPGGYSKDYTLTTTSKTKRVYTRKEEANTELVYKITVVTVSSLDDAVEKYKEDRIDMFFANSERAIDLLGKYEYNILSYRNGNSLFLLGNNESDLIKRQEVRNAICYGVDRDAIIKDIFKHNVELIDLPYIYDEVKYKYDYIAAENALLSNGYIKINKAYTKKEDGKSITLSLKLIVNKEDSTKIKVANNIKRDLSKIGITLNIHKLSEKEIRKQIEEKDYDLVLADIALNENPNIKFLDTYLYITEKGKELSQDIGKNLDKNILDLYRQNLSDEYSFFGIKADNIFVIYNKDIENISNVKYMNIFSGLMTKIDKVN